MSNALFFAPSSLQNPTSEFKGDQIGLHSADRTDQGRTCANKLNGDGQSFLATLEEASHGRSLQAEAVSAGRTQSSDKKELNLSGRLQQAGTEPADDSCNAAADQTGISENFCQAETNANLSLGNFAGLIDALQAMGFYQSTGGSDWQTSAASGQTNGPDLAALEQLMREIHHNPMASAADWQTSAASGQTNGPDLAALEQLIRFIQHNSLASAADWQTSAASGQTNGPDLAALEQLIRSIQHNSLAPAADLQTSAASGQTNGPDLAALEQLIRSIQHNSLAPAADMQTSTASGQTNGPDLAALKQLIRSIQHNSLASAADMQTSAASGQTNGPDLAALEQLIRSIQHNSLASAADMPSGFQRLQEFIAALPAGSKPSEPDGNPGRDLTSEQFSDLARIGRWLTGPGTDQPVAPNLGGEYTGEGALNEKSSGTVATETLIAGTLTKGPLEITGENKGVGANQSAEHPLIDSSSEDRKKPNPDKSQDGATFKNAAADASSGKEAQAALAGLKTLRRTEDPNQTASAAGDRRQPQGEETARAGLSAAKSTAAELKPEAGNLTEKAGQVPSAEDALARLLSESQGTKEVNSKEKTGIGAEAFGKVLKTEAGTSDNSLFNSAGQHTEKAAETAAVPREPAAGQTSPPTQALDQIVQRARIQLSGGQHEARVDLKPEFLGHVRMQVVAENHQVTLKILTEHGFVKDMIENNIHQLKADLQQQGMTIDKLEVSVSRDPDEFGSPKEKQFGSKSRQDAAAHSRHERPSDEKPKNRGRSFRRADGSVTLDYFA